MTLLTDYQRYADAQQHFSPAKLWDLFEGDRESFNIAHECVDRHAASGRDALIVVHADGSEEIITYAELSAESSRFAHFLESEGVARGDRVAIMLEPSKAFYVAMFGVIKHGAIAVPMFTLFGPDGIALRVDDCKPVMLLTQASKVQDVANLNESLNVQIYDSGFERQLQAFPVTYSTQSRSDELAVFQYTSGTTRELPEAVRHTHRALVTLMVAALYGTGLRPGDRFFCPSSPAWGHGLWHGTLAPLALGLTVGAYSGRFNPVRLVEALSKHKFTNMSAAATHYRIIKNSGVAEQYPYSFEKLSFTGEPIDDDTADFIKRVFGLEVCSMYGTTEIGVVLVSYPGAPDFEVRRGSLGKPIPGGNVQVQDAKGNVCAPGETGEMMAVEIENVMLMHPDVLEAAAIGVPDALRGQVVKAFVVSHRDASDAFSTEIQDLVKQKLSQHEYPRHVAFVPELPKTPAGKVHRKVLREREALERAS